MAFLSIIFIATFSPVKMCVANLTLPNPPLLKKYLNLNYKKFFFIFKDFLIF